MLTEYRKFASRTFDWISDKYPDVLNPVKFTLPKSGLMVSPKNYISTICLTMSIGYFISLIITSILILTVLKLNIFLTVLSFIFVPVIVGMIILVAGVFYPYERVISRKRNIETNLPFAISHMGAIAASGVSPQAIFKLLSEFKEYDVIAEEMQKVVRNVEVFGIDPMTALKEVSKRTPSEKFRQLLQGLTTTIEGGGDLRTFLKNAGEQALFRWRIKREKYLDQLSTYAEFYTGLMIAAPLFLISLFSVMNMIQPELGGFDIAQLMTMSVYLLIPAMNTGFIIFLNMTQVEM
ncbi:MAG: type II secretion system F family protein [Candidatus Aenigmarchaeota archaeon]|nr:type II secretion system F family protein [Candidatus Aenigmarchaeota archaeon]